MKSLFATTAALIALAAPCAALAQGETIKLVNVLELSGAIASAGTNYRNGVELAVKEINDAGGVLGRKFEVTTLDNQSNPGVAKALAAKAVDMGAFAVIGPLGCDGRLDGRDAARRDSEFHGRRCRLDYAPGQPVRLSHQPHPIHRHAQGGPLHQGHVQGEYRRHHLH
jgi:hypothetical protein